MPRSARGDARARAARRDRAAAGRASAGRRRAAASARRQCAGRGRSSGRPARSASASCSAAGVTTASGADLLERVDQELDALLARALLRRDQPLHGLVGWAARRRRRRSPSGCQRARHAPARRRPSSMRARRSEPRSRRAVSRGSRAISSDARPPGQVVVHDRLPAVAQRPRAARDRVRLVGADLEQRDAARASACGQLRRSAAGRRRGRPDRRRARLRARSSPPRQGRNRVRRDVGQVGEQQVDRPLARLHRSDRPWRSRSRPRRRGRRRSRRRAPRASAETSVARNGRRAP